MLFKNTDWILRDSDFIDLGIRFFLSFFSDSNVQNLGAIVLEDFDVVGSRLSPLAS